MSLNILIRNLEKEEIDNALCLVWRVFQEYEAPDYTEEGVKEFYKSIHDDNYLSKLCLYGAFNQEELVGVIATRSEGTHIALFFVEGKYHRQGIGKKLFHTVKAKCYSDKMTVNSSPYAIPIYHKLGFQDTSIEQVINGLRFTPMELKINNKI
ncbi:GCN5-related N-acetyltransferase [Anaeromyces robustus]|uniref:GCN5-related N-acetyltransferase n=1 Tax=Anaeromyces robustus TaxID=1754192 RepID=A0A1Y1WY89_9FUNG|nr:GCN5-related N-acetyltransferase [Anaeromyces robustus]|eukprot:ORX78539.1 GCN5-related N-acetyltransferase [Anaeromyces robustus]